MLMSIFKRLKLAGANFILLNTQYRMHLLIAKLIIESGYKNQDRSNALHTDLFTLNRLAQELLAN
jgi:hypothetical protein